MLKKLRITLAIICFTMITLLFLDFTGTLHAWFGWMAKLQFVPALLASGSITVLAIIIVTMTFGRIYCSILCPLGVYQDGISRMAEKRKKNRYKFKKSRKWLRYSILLVFAVLLFVGLNSIAILIAPYSIYGRIASNLFAPLYQLINNVLAYFAERWDSYAFYHVDVYIKSLPIFIVSIAYFLIITILSLTSGRWYCNTVCPVGTILGFFARGSLFKPVIDTEKCNSCGLCERNCRCSAIDSKNHKIDYTKCVTCFNCIEKCHQGAMRYRLAGNIDNVNKVKTIGDETKNGKTSRKTFIATVATLAAASTLKAQEKVVDGGLATIEKKKAPKRETPIKPAGSLSLDNFSSRCTGCQLCVQVCPNDVLRACTKCSEVCPAGAITKVTREQKTAIQIGHAVWIGRNCVPLRDGVSCGNCAKHCPSGAINMMPYDPEDATSPLIPTINTEKCIGCGACEHVCPARPFSAIFVEGNVIHINI